MKSITTLLKNIVLLLALFYFNLSFSQQTYYNVTAGNGNGLRFWNSNNYKIHMGTGTEYKYGPVQDYSIKSNMGPAGSTRGWTWGVAGAIPIAGLDVKGNFQIAKDFTAMEDIKMGGSNSWIMHTPDDGRKDLYLAPRNSVNTGWDWSKQFIFAATGKSYFRGDMHLEEGRNILLRTSTNDTGDIVFQKQGGANQLGRIWADPIGDGRLYISSKDNNPDISIRWDGKVGIRNTNAQAELDVNGDAVIDRRGVDFSSIRLGHSGNDRIFSDNSANKYYGGGLFFRVHDESLPHKYRDAMMIADNGNIGIDTRTPQNKLSVNGHIWAKEVKVMLTDGADWVFEDDYNLKTLKEVEDFIKENKHLPEIPSAEDFRKNDMKVSEMTNKLLQKIEELTLYTIDQEKQLEAQKQKNEALEARLAKLEKLLNN